MPFRPATSRWGSWSIPVADRRNNSPRFPTLICRVRRPMRAGDPLGRTPAAWRRPGSIPPDAVRAVSGSVSSVGRDGAWKSADVPPPGGRGPSCQSARSVRGRQRSAPPRQFDALDDPAAAFPRWSASRSHWIALEAGKPCSATVGRSGVGQARGRTVAIAPAPPSDVREESRVEITVKWVSPASVACTCRRPAYAIGNVLQLCRPCG